MGAHSIAQDSDDPNPLIRALAIRTMTCIRVEKMCDYIGDLLKKALKVRFDLLLVFSSCHPGRPPVCAQNGRNQRCKVL
jgi:hypothetical protein